MIPDSQSIMIPYLRLISDQKEWGFQKIIERLGQQFKVSNTERQEMIPSGQKIFDYRVGYSRTIYKRAGFIESTRHGYVRITKKGLKFLSDNPSSIRSSSFKKTIKENQKRETRNLPNIKATFKNKKNTIDKFYYIRALGNLLVYYKSDLEYIRNFQSFKNGLIDSDKYLTKAFGFQDFLAEFKIARNSDKTKRPQLLSLTKRWISGHDPDNVDDFAEYLKDNNLTFGKTMTSLASKILFLNNPWRITPSDSRARKTLGLISNSYSEYFPIVQEFILTNQTDIKYYLDSVHQHLTVIESSFENELKEVKAIRKNRFVDKILWTMGQN
jgi:hypothetical protein